MSGRSVDMLNSSLFVKTHLTGGAVVALLTETLLGCESSVLAVEASRALSAVVHRLQSCRIRKGSSWTPVGGVCALRAVSASWAYCWGRVYAALNAVKARAAQASGFNLAQAVAVWACGKWKTKYF